MCCSAAVACPSEALSKQQRMFRKVQFFSYVPEQLVARHGHQAHIGREQLRPGRLIALQSRAQLRGVDERARVLEAEFNASLDAVQGDDQHLSRVAPWDVVASVLDANLIAFEYLALKALKTRCVRHRR